MKKYLLFLLLCISVNAQTTLNPGDIAIVRINEDSPSDGFSFVSLVSISSGTVIYFTEEGWLNTTWIGNTESHLKYTAPIGGLSAGSVVHIDETATSDVFSIAGAGGTITFAWGTSNFNLSSGDQILAYQTTSSTKPSTIANLTFITGLTLNDGNGSDVRNYNDPITHWTVSTYAELSQTGVDRSTLPSGLTNGSNCISVFPDFNVLTEKDNARYGCSLTSGTKAQLLSAINDHDNWIYDDNANYATSSVCSFTVSTAAITFTNGSAFIQSITPGSSDQVLGRFQLTGNISGSYLTAASIKLNGTRNGLNNFKLWSSTDASFGGDSQAGSTVAVDPGNGNSVSFSGFSSSISTSGTYYFLTADVSASPSGTVQGEIVQNSSLTINSGTISGTISNALLSNGTSPLPVELSSFTASSAENKVILNWQTATEVNNYGFQVERQVGSMQSAVGNQNNPHSATSNPQWEVLGFVEGNGNSNSPKEYSFVDENPPAGNLQYRLKQIDTEGSYEYYSTIAEVNYSLTAVDEKQIPTEFALLQNYPNPFNPATTISYQIPVGTHRGVFNQGVFVQLKVYDVLGNEVATLVNEEKAPGTYEITFDAGKYKLSSGTYFYRINAGEFTATKKLMIMK